MLHLCILYNMNVYLITYCEWTEVNDNVNKFQRICGTISRTLKRKTQLSTEI